MSNLPTQAALEGFNFQKLIRFSDFTETASGTEEVIDCFTIPTDAIVTKVGFFLVENFDGGATTDLTIELGDDDDDNGFTVAAIIHEDATEVSSAINSGAYFNDGTTDNTVNGKVYDNAAVKTLKAAFIPTAAALTALTAGKVLIKAEIIDLSLDL